MKYIIIFFIILLTYSCKIGYEDLEYNVCSVTNQNGTCPDGKICNIHGICEVDNKCSVDTPYGTCDENYICKDGSCVDKCSPEKPNGTCKKEYFCDSGICKSIKCSPENLNGTCESGHICVNGTCKKNNKCSISNPNGICNNGFICSAGECKNECSSQNPSGACKAGFECKNGNCVANEIDLGEFKTFTGTWAQKQTLYSVTRSFGTNNKSTNYSYSINTIIQKNNLEMEVNSKTCEIIVDVDSDFASTTIPKRYIEHLGEMNVIYTYYKKNDDIMIRQDKDINLKGVRMDNPETDNMPENAEDDRVFDQDEDGNPGMTIVVTAIGSLSKIYVAQRTMIELEGKITNKNEFAGKVIWSEEQAMLGAEIEALNQPMEIMPNLEKSVFKSVRIDSTWTCEDIMNNKDTIFKD